MSSLTRNLHSSVGNETVGPTCGLLRLYRHKYHLLCELYAVGTPFLDVKRSEPEAVFDLFAEIKDGRNVT